MKLRVNQGSRVKPYWISLLIHNKGQLREMLRRYGDLPHEFICESPDDALMLYDLKIIN